MIRAKVKYTNEKNIFERNSSRGVPLSYFRNCGKAYWYPKSAGEMAHLEKFSRSDLFHPSEGAAKVQGCSPCVRHAGTTCFESLVIYNPETLIAGANFITVYVRPPAHVCVSLATTKILWFFILYGRGVDLLGPYHHGAILFYDPGVSLEYC